MLYLWKVEILMVTSGWSYVVGVAGETREPTGFGLWKTLHAINI